MSPRRVEAVCGLGGSFLDGLVSEGLADEGLLDPHRRYRFSQ